jgi:hypothetical protein
LADAAGVTTNTMQFDLILVNPYAGCNVDTVSVTTGIDNFDYFIGTQVIKSGEFTNDLDFCPTMFMLTDDTGSPDGYNKDIFAYSSVTGVIVI